MLRRHARGQREAVGPESEPSTAALPSTSAASSCLSPLPPPPSLSSCLAALLVRIRAEAAGRGVSRVTRRGCRAGRRGRPRGGGLCVAATEWPFPASLLGTPHLPPPPPFPVSPKSWLQGFPSWWRGVSESRLTPCSRCGARAHCGWFGARAPLVPSSPLTPPPSLLLAFPPHFHSTPSVAPSLLPFLPPPPSLPPRVPSSPFFSLTRSPPPASQPARSPTHPLARPPSLHSCFSWPALSSLPPSPLPCPPSITSLFFVIPLPVLTACHHCLPS